MNLTKIIFFSCLLLLSACAEKVQVSALEHLLLEDQYGTQSNIDINQDEVIVILFKADKKISSEGVKWTRALKKHQKSEVIYPILEFKNAYTYLPLFATKHIATHHLQGEFYNPAITDKEDGERHPTIYLDWHNSVAHFIDRSSDVWVLKYLNGNLEQKIIGEYSEEKLQQLKTS